MQTAPCRYPTPRACSGRCPNGPGSSDSDAWVWRCWSRCGVTPPARVRPRAAAGSGPGSAMTRCSKSTASSWDSWAPGGVARNTGCSRVLMGSSWSSSSARANSWCPWTLPSGGPTPPALGRRAATNCTGCRACWMDAWRPFAGAAWNCPRRWSSPIVGLAIRNSCAMWPPPTRARSSWKGRVPMSSSCPMGGRSRATTCSSTAIGPGVIARRSLGYAMRGCGPPVRRMGR